MGPPTEDGVLVNTPEMKTGGNWTPDNRYVVYTGSDPRTRLDLWKLSPADRTPTPYLQTAFNEMHGQVSPDGRWIAYASDESGNWEVYVRTFPVPGGKRTISIDGGAEPQWRRDGRELYYLTPDGTLMSVAVHSGEEFAAASPKPLFRARISSDIITYRNHYTVTADGHRFLIDEVDDPEPINVVVNCSALLH